MSIRRQPVEAGSVLAAEVVIVGGGAAGITLARELERDGREVMLLESGGLAYEEEVQDLYGGEAEGTILPRDSNYLRASRLRYLGGSTNHWQGWCRPLDPQDLEPREWVPESGWPLAMEELAPHYRRAAAVAQITPFSHEPSPEGLLPPAEVETTLIHLSPPTRFGAAYREELAASRRIRVLLHASVTRILVSEGGDRVEGLEVASLGGQRFLARGAAYVLAAGAVENARLLLASNQVQAEGLGNRHDLVGRYFMDHPFRRAGALVAPSRRQLMGLYQARRDRERGHEVRGVLRLPFAEQRRHRLHNALLVLFPLRLADLPSLAKEVGWASHELERLARGGPALSPGETYYGEVRVAGEQAPNPASRVRLSRQRDALGIPRTHLDWRLTAADAGSVRRSADLLARALGGTLRGRMQFLFEEGDPWGEAMPSNHHMGTTRMHPDPARGVVDPSCRLHGVANLFVAGSSVFPTSGASNPTLTILALTLRLAEHLRGWLP